ncbi:transglycosylase [Leptospira interrogans str. 2003000735]|uniref:Membrane carboxypeptidase/penicillin-binding protein n=5 Tax=Leptospira interrogans TaxID=173 RepID=Q8F005_LEPIN|nr:transglycosylase domain-containing protein [Leptospira interrogans]EMM81819.1 transglycosylase [Leptospira interrogans str. 2006001854]EMY07100.1 transglycosylase [Leptospira interrogans str. 2002000626]AAN50890.1 membrane carboxypeptidase/penicillin-binding protein [Leptospira interrogans serovar Lai str. 56601]AER03732.1 membrane carboxypeptidase/penicillin-binding protein [Leptospira interrogans serovar Lai str. IPAV]EKN86991.1 transglycosylase [Leptospira interrogans str. 2002000624]
MASGNEKVVSLLSSFQEIVRKIFFFSKAHWRKILRYAIIVTISVISFLIGGSYVVWLSKKDKVVSNLDKFKNEVTNYYEVSQIRPIRILDRNGKLIGEFSRRKFKPIRTDNLAEHGNIIWALLSSEDREFYNHHGINYTALLRAIFINLTTFQKQGGSTITQQLAKLTLDLGARNIFNKITEFYCTFYLENQFDKNTILSMYLNRIFLGEGNTGVEEASRYYFNKAATELTPEEAAMLVGIIPAPSNYNPVRSLKTALKRQKLVLIPMAQNQHLHPNPSNIDKNFPRKIDSNLKKFKSFYNVEITKDGEKEFYSSDIARYGFDKDFTVNLAPDFNYGIRQHILDTFSEIDIETRGMNVYTTLDYDKQEAAEKSLREGIESVRKKLNETKASYSKKGNSEETRIQQSIIDNMNGSLISINPGNGYIEAMVGSYKISNIFRLNRAVSALRQPGSTIKALVYTIAFENRIITPSSMVIDEAINIRGYSPKNWYKGYKGEVTARIAFAQSINTIAVKLLNEFGVNEFLEKISMILDIDKSTLEKRFQPNLSLALGSGELSPMELALIYATIVNGGKKVSPIQILRITDFEGSEMFSTPLKDPNEAVQILDSVACAETINLLEAVLSEQGTMKLKLKDEDSFPMGGKTGTVQSPKEARKKWGSRKGVRDVWFAGINPDLVTTVWIGNDVGAPFEGSGSAISGNIWFRYVNYIAKNIGFSNTLIKPFNGDFVQVDVCGETGLQLHSSVPCMYPLYGQYYYIGEQPPSPAGSITATPETSAQEPGTTTNPLPQAEDGDGDSVELELPETTDNPPN